MKCGSREAMEIKVIFYLIKPYINTSSKTCDGLCWVSGTKAVRKIPSDIFSGNLSIARAILIPPKLCPTRTTFSLGASDAKRSNKGLEYSENVWMSSMSCVSMPEAARSRTVTLWPADSNSGLSLYQHQAPWPIPCTRTKWFCSLCFLLILPFLRFAPSFLILYIDKNKHDQV